MALTSEQLASYEKNGFLVVENLVTGDTLRRIRDAITEICEEVASRGTVRVGEVQAEPDDPAGVGAVATTKAPAAVRRPLRKLNALVPGDDFFKSVAARPEILDIAAKLAGGAEHIMLYSDQVFLKPAFEGSEKPLHQDNSYFRVTPHTHGVTCWLAVDDATEENGCMRYIPGSHKLGLIPHKQLTPAHLTPEGSGFGEEVPVPVKAGTAIFHHLLTLHSSRANSSPHSRRAWALHYANRAAESTVRKWEDMVQLR
jgi:ectoine hydroxylase-related dioxygenase (phytanoyl-CoA dioxygenase family)